MSRAIRKLGPAFAGPEAGFEDSKPVTKQPGKTLPTDVVDTCGTHLNGQRTEVAKNEKRALLFSQSAPAPLQ